MAARRGRRLADVSAYDAFLSHASCDRDIALRLVECLEGQGIRCWIAPRDIEDGRLFSEEIVRGIENSRTMVVLCSEGSLSSVHVCREIERADSKGRPILPVFLDRVEARGAAGYYLGSLQNMRVGGQPVESFARRIAERVRDPERPAEAPQVTTDALVALGRSICRDVREVLDRAVSPETAAVVEEPRPGAEVLMVDLEANRRARETVATWARRHDVAVQLVGEDLAPDEEQGEADVLVLLDAVDGTQHWLRGRNLWCTAVSIFERAGARHELRASLVHMPDERLYVAREDTRTTHLDGREGALRARSTRTSTLERAHVCTVARRPEQFDVLRRLLEGGSPFAGLYTFGGNPILMELLARRYDAVFQPDASALADDQELWDWLPGGHILVRAGCPMLALDGSELDVPALAQAAIGGVDVRAPFVTAPNGALAVDILAWLRRAVGGARLAGSEPQPVRHDRATPGSLD